MQTAQANAALFTKMQQDHIFALENIATATQADRTSVALLTKTISELLGQLATLTPKHATAQTEKARLKKSGHCLAPAKHGRRASRNQTPSDHNSLQDQNVYLRSGHKFDPNGYCSPHGYKVKESHTSTTCRLPGNGHNKLATRMEIRGGETCNKDWSHGGPTK